MPAALILQDSTHDRLVTAADAHRALESRGAQILIP
jgi:hypothetical protein